MNPTSPLETPDSPMKMVVVDDHDLIRERIRELFSEDPNIRIVGEASEEQEAVQLITDLQPDIVLLDIRLSLGNGIGVTKAAKSVAPHSKIVILTAYSEDQYVVSLFKLGVSGYLLKTLSGQELREAVHDAAAGKFVFAEELRIRLTALLERGRKRLSKRGHEIRRLTSREREVLGHLSKGLSNGEIAVSLGIAVKTVETHVDHILLKLGVDNRTQAALTGLQDGGGDRMARKKPA